MLRFLLPLLIASRVLAQDDPAVRRIVSYVCTFTTECFEGEACQATEFEAILALIGQGDDIDRVFMRGTMRSDAGDIEVGGPLISDTLSLQGLGTFPSGHLLTRAPDGTARYSAHLPGPLMVSYQGICE